MLMGIAKNAFVIRSQHRPLCEGGGIMKGECVKEEHFTLLYVRVLYTLHSTVHVRTVLVISFFTHGQTFSVAI